MHHVAMLAELDESRPRAVEAGHVKILLVREGDVVHAFGAECPHAGAPLDEGAICDGRIICPWHKASFRLRDGALLEPPALDRLTRYPVRIEGGAVLVSPEPIIPMPAPRTDDPRTMLIVGAGAAGTAAACALREFGFDGRVVLLGDEPGEPYDRTSLSKFVLQGAMPPEQVPPLREAGFYQANRIERVQGRAAALDPEARKLTLTDGTALDYDSLLVATGGTPRLPEVPGAHLPGVHTLRSREDASAILSTLSERLGSERLGSERLERDGTTPVVIVGASFIGLEAASALREQEIPVAVVSPAEIPFAGPFGDRIGTMFRRLHESHGVEFIGGRRLARIEGATGVTAVVLDDGRRIDTPLVLVGIGVDPATGFADALEKTEDGGIIVGTDMRATGMVFAAGDIARFPLGSRSQVRVEHWRVAQQHARRAARGMLGQACEVAPIPFFWTYHYGKRYEYLGHPRDFDQVHIDGDLDAGDFLARLLHHGETVGIVACGRETETAFLIAQPGACRLGA